MAHGNTPFPGELDGGQFAIPYPFPDCRLLDVQDFSDFLRRHEWSTEHRHISQLLSLFMPSCMFISVDVDQWMQTDGARNDR